MPGTCQIFAGVGGSPGSVHALRQAAQLAHHHDALLIPVLAWPPPDSRRLPWPPSLAQQGWPRPARLGVPAPLSPGRLA